MMFLVDRKKRLLSFLLTILVLTCSTALQSDPRGKAHHALPSREESSLLHNRPDLNTVPPEAPVNQNYGRVPLSFEANHGQADSEVKFLSRVGGYGIYLTPTEAVLTLQNRSHEKRTADQESPAQQLTIDSTPSAVLRVRLVRANTAIQVKGLEQLPGKSNYFVGNDPRKFHTNIPTYAKVRYANVYPGVDLIYYGRGGELEYDFAVTPGANPNVIGLAFEGAQDLSVDENGELVLMTAVGEIRQHRPVVYQVVNGVRQEAHGRYVIVSDHEVRLEVGEYDRSKLLVIDPVLVYASYIGDGNGALGVAVDSRGDAYLTGGGGLSFPTTPGAFQNLRGGVFVMKVNAAGTAVVYSTFLGPGLGRSIAVDSSGSAYITGFTSSDKFPTTSGAVQTSYGGGNVDAFIAKLGPTGCALVYSTYLGGEFSDAASGIVTDSSGYAYVTGHTTSKQFPTTSTALQTSFAGGESYGDIFVTKVNAGGSALLYSTYLGGSGDEGFRGGIAVDSSGNAFVTSATTSFNFPTTAGAFNVTLSSTRDFGNAIVSKLNATGSALLYSTYLGGNGLDEGRAIAVDSSGSAYVAGFTTSSDFPVTPLAFSTTCKECISPPLGAGGGDPFVVSGDAFVSKLDPGGTALVYSTFLGGTEDDGGNSIAVDSLGSAYVAGVTNSEDFPITPNALRPAAGSNDAFVTKLDATGSALVFSTYFGGRSSDVGNGVALDSAGDAYVAGYTLSLDLPTTPGGFQAAFNSGGNAFIFKIQLGPVVSGASVKGKKLVVSGNNFDDGAVIMLDGEAQRTRNDDEDPKTRLIGKKAGKKIAPGQAVMIQVKNSTGMMSLQYSFTRPAE